jgi:hypothetical protein
MIDPPGLDADSEPDIGCDRAHLMPLERSAQAAGCITSDRCTQIGEQPENDCRLTAASPIASAVFSETREYVELTIPDDMPTM